jgi:hypothetical protein
LSPAEDDLVPDLPDDFMAEPPPTPSDQQVMVESKPSQRKRRVYREVPYHPARKPRDLQWAAQGFFICSRCKAKYHSRLRLHLHKKKKCFNEIWLEDKRFKQILENSTQHSKENIRLEMGLPKL